MTQHSIFIVAAVAAGVVTAAAASDKNTLDTDSVGLNSQNCSTHDGNDHRADKAADQPLWRFFGTIVVSAVCGERG